MRRGPFVLVLLLVSFVLALLLALGSVNLWARPLVEFAVNSSTQPFFRGSVRIDRVSLGRMLQVRIEDARAIFYSEVRPVPIALRSLRSQGSLLRFFSKKGGRLEFEGLGFQESKHAGLRGEGEIRAAKDWSLDFKIELQDVGLEELEWLNPENLGGASGGLRGEIQFRTDSEGRMGGGADLRVGPPGGLLPAKFFEILRPYLPASVVPAEVDFLVAHVDLVSFHEARLQAELVDSDRMKTFLHIAVPDYNLNLNVNLEIRLDEKNAFQDLLQLAGIVSGRAPGGLHGEGRG